MAITKAKKAEIYEKVKEVAAKPTVAFVNFHGLPVAETTEIRRKLREAGLSYYVAKKTLVRKAFEDSNVTGELPELTGELALAYPAEGTDDITLPAREVFAFQKKYKDNISLLGGVFEGTYLSKTGIEEIALIPGHDVLKGMFVNIINSPIQGFVMTLKALADKKA